MRYEMTWRNKFLTIHAKTIDEMAAKLERAAIDLKAMAADGLILDGGVESDYAVLATHDPVIAEKWGMLDDENSWM